MTQQKNIWANPHCRRTDGIRECCTYTSHHSFRRSQRRVLVGYPLSGGARVNPATDRLYVVCATPPRNARAQNDVPLKTAIAERFLRLVELQTFPLDRLSRYEHLLWRQARQLVITLESLRRRQRQHTRSVFPFSFRRPVPDDFSAG